MHAQGSWRHNKTVSTNLLAGLTMSAKWDDQTAISKSLKSGTLPTFTMLRNLLSVEKVIRELVHRNFPELSSSGKFSHAFHCVVSYPRNVINKLFREPGENQTVEAKPRTKPNLRILNDPHPYTREIHPLDPQPHRYCMLASTASAPRVMRCSRGLYWSRDLCSKHALAGWGMSSYLGQIVRGSEIWWFMTSAHSLSTSLSLYRIHTKRSLW